MPRQRIAHGVLALATLPLATLACPRAAHAHVAPSPTENNRYVKVSLQPERVRLSYTVFFGERPGAGERQRMDRDRNGLLDEVETRQFGQSVRDDVAGHLHLVLDGQPVPPAQLTVEDVGLGMATASGGSFSVDLLLTPAVRGAGSHRLTVADGWIVPDAGEAEIFVEESPGVRVVSARLESAAPGPLQLRWAFRGNPENDDARRVLVEWNVDDAAYREAAAATPRATTAAPAHRSRRALWLALGGGLIGALVLVVMAKRTKPAG